MNKNKMVTKKDTSAMFMSKVIALTNYNMTPEYLEEILRSEPNNRVCKEVRRIAKLNNNDLVNLYENALTIRNAEAKKTEVPAVEETLPIEYLVDHQCAIDAIKVANKRIAELETELSRVKYELDLAQISVKICNERDEEIKQLKADLKTEQTLSKAFEHQADELKAKLAERIEVVKLERDYSKKLVSEIEEDNKMLKEQENKIVELEATIDRMENCANNYKMWYNESEEKLGKAFQRIGGLQYLLSEMQKGRKDKGLELVVKEALKDMPK
jgi:chromosome segregation ATPase